MTFSCLLGNIESFSYFSRSRLTVGNWCLSRISTISYWFLFSILEYRLLKPDLMIFWSSSVFIVMSLFSFLILVIWVLSLCLLVHLGKGLSILLIFSKSQLLDSLTLNYPLCFSLIDLISVLFPAIQSYQTLNGMRLCLTLGTEACNKQSSCCSLWWVMHMTASLQTLHSQV